MEIGSWQAASLLGMARGLQMRGVYPKDRSALLTLIAGDSPQQRTARQQVTGVLTRAGSIARDHQAPMNVRLAAIGVLGYTDAETSADTLDSLLAPNHPTEIQLAAVRSLSQLPGRTGLASLVERKRWASFTPEVREAALAALTVDDSRTLMLLDAIENGSIPAAALSAARRNRLTNHRNSDVQKRAQALLTAFQSGDRMQTFERVRGSVAARSGSAESGGRVFSTYCATCHSFSGKGGTLGPDLSGIRNQPPDAILLHVLVPDYEITPGYYAYVVETRDGRTLVGRLVSETPNSVTLHEASGQQQVILRTQIASMTASSNSLMPSELERAMSEQDLADLIQYLKTARNSR
jgi:putative heme-binding domain-containing protein